jgi:hypothetical protein
MASAVVATVDLYCHYRSSLFVLDFIRSVILNLLSLRPSILKNRIALAITALLLLYLGFHSLFCTYLIIAFYCIFYLYAGEYKHKRAIKLISLFLIMIVFAIYQSQSLHELKSHYANYETGETWQKYGAL